ncbi:MAG: hypothetical protein KAS07_04870 [Candidatus Pacebacteria bacterium]|nr:hypothetical protein [Candidatus Paceibacterota bacterium]
MVLTTIRVEKPVVDWLNTLKGHIEYISGEKLTLNDALVSIIAEVDWLYLKGRSTTNSDKSEVTKQIMKRFDQFWGEESTDKPVIVATDTGNIAFKERKEDRKNKNLLDM